ncbi:MAG: NHL repeat-containing protein, partial [Dehalococcoidia bacterium]
SGPGQFHEPVGIAIGSDGTIYVADAWNNRIETFDSKFTFKSEIALGGSWVDGQNGKDIENKPYLAALPDGTLLASFPDGNALVQYDATGKVLRSTNRLPGMATPLQRPLGIAVDASGNVIVSDSILNEVVRLPESALP